MAETISFPVPTLHSKITPSFQLRFQSSIAQTIGFSSRGASVRLTERIPLMSGVHCQSQFLSVGNSARAGWFVSHSKPSIASKRGLRFCGGRTVIWTFQNTGTLRIGGHFAGSRSVAVGVNKTLPPAESFFSASAQTLVTSTSLVLEFSTDAG